MEAESNSRLISLIKKSLTYYGLDQPIPEHNKNDKMEILKVLNICGDGNGDCLFVQQNDTVFILDYETS